MAEALIFACAVGALVLLTHWLGGWRYEPVESAPDVDPVSLEDVRRRNEAQLQVTRERCFAHDFDEHQANTIQIGRTRNFDRHQAFPLQPEEWCEELGHIFSWDEARCIRCGKATPAGYDSDGVDRREF